ncbi:hypothetical protein COV19_03050 [Candidatus Woesearchaeota archaeon CG10_big_fil_rev_8_21_14_0_10_44_13]|nr:MAG: hypothetical protein COV19_03050 [Candidatus Woesearchaeota archaeon CG10_big_fil_rev_8_21_14_0_10_44_13]
MKTPKTTAILMILIVMGLFLIPGCGSKKTTVRYIVPTGYTVLEAKAGDAGQTTQGTQGSQPVSIVIKNDEPKDNTTINAPKNQTANISARASYSTVVEPTTHIRGEYTPFESDVKALKPKICSINEVIVGYVGCYYNGDKTEARVTLKDTGRGDIEQMWFYLVFAGQTIYMESEGFDVGNINDYNLMLSEWSKKYNGKIQRILITPVIKEGNFVFICNNRQLLLIPDNSCRETVE